MTIVTHVAFGTLFAASAHASISSGIACALGAALPDIDSPRSSIGRLFFFLSIPLNRLIGHRGLSHSFPLWAVPLFLGLLTSSPILQWLAIGAMSHVLIDCYTVSGVQALLSFNERTVVIFKKDWRVRTGSVQEIVICLIFLGLIGGTQYSYTLGGPRKLINRLMKSPQITVDEYTRAGNAICRVKGRWRWADGRIEPVDWLVVGTEKKSLIFWNGERLLRLKHGQFLRSTLVQNDRTWSMTQVKGIVIVAQDSVYFANETWTLARAGEKAYGLIKTISGDIPEIQIDRPALHNAQNMYKEK